MPMMTIDQWKTARRVDHEQIVLLGHVFNRRTRPRPPYADLKVFDADVIAFGAAQTRWEKIRALGDIIADARLFIANAPQNLQPRYLTAVKALRDSAAAELATVTGADTPPGIMRTDVEAISAGTALTPKTASLQVYALLPGSSTMSDATINGRINSHITEANRLFNPAGVQATRLNSVLGKIPTTYSGRPTLDNGRFDELRESPFVLVKYIEAQNSGAAISVVYVDRFKEDDVQGFCCRKGGVYSGATPTKPIVVVTLNPPGAGAATYNTTLGHELTHGITGDGSHSNDADSLMAGGSIRNGTNDVSLGMLAWLRNNDVL